MKDKMRKGGKKKLIRVYPTKDKVGWLISLGVWGRFTPSTAEEYLTLPAEALKDIQNIQSIIIKEVEK